MESGYQFGNAPLLALVVILELGFGIFYAWWVDRLKTSGRETGYAAFLVVGGTFATIALVTPIIGLMNAIVVLMAFVITGTPMILWATYRHTEDNKAKKQAEREFVNELQREFETIYTILEKLRHIEQQLNGENDGE